MTNYKPVTEEVLEELRKAVGAEHVKMMPKLWALQNRRRAGRSLPPSAGGSCSTGQHRRGSCCYENRQ